jgi:hypothetical protein
MSSVFICFVSFFVTYVLARRSLVWGLAACMALGYGFGVLRANILDTFSFLIWDASVLGVYASYFCKRPSPEQLQMTGSLRMWVGILMLWPLILTFVPAQDPLIQLVGLRGNMFLLPFLLIGGRLTTGERDEFAYFLAALNLIALSLAITEYFVGLEMFFPHNAVTELIYNSRDVAGNTAFRIPAFFINAHAYAGTMVMTIPFQLGIWVREREPWRKNLLSAGMVAALTGVFLAASRTHTVILFVLLATAMMNANLKAFAKVSLIMILVFTGWIVSNNERLQRFATLLDSEFVSTRIASSIDLPVVEAALEYPFGVGMGGGGTSIPYFLQDRIIEPVAAENEYIRIMLEEGVVGVALWIAFVVWMLVRKRAGPSSIGRKLARCASLSYFAMALLGTGVLTSVPQTSLMLIAAGWAASESEHA